MNIGWDFKDKAVLVVGGTSGINLAVAVAFARIGARVAVVSRNQERVQKAVAQLGGSGFGFSADVRDLDALTAGVADVRQRFGALDVVISGAAGNFPAAAMAMSANGFKSVVDIDLLGTYHVSRAVYPHLTRPGASFINISAPQAQVAMPGQIHVCAAKAGVDMITKTLAQEWGPEGIRVNSVIPGPIAGTEGMARLAPTEQALAACVASVPLKRLGSCADIANTCLFLAGPFAGFINGAIIPVDGGWLAGGAAGIASALAASGGDKTMSDNGPQ